MLACVIVSSGQFFPLLTCATHHFLLTTYNHNYHQVMKLGVEMIVLVHSIVQFVNLILIFFCMLFKIKYKNMHGKNVPSDIYPN